MSEERAFGFGNKTLEEFLEELASGAAVPGGGSAAALGVATGAALASMVCRLTGGREKYRNNEEVVRNALEDADGLRMEALELVIQDAVAYTRVMNAYELPKRTEEEKSGRADQIEEVLKAATEVSLRTVVVALRVLEICDGIVDVTNPNARADLGVGTLMARAALEGAALNVKTNLELIRDEEFRSSTIGQLEDCLETTSGLAENVLRAPLKR